MILRKGVGHENVGADLAAPLDLLLNALDVAYLLKMLTLLYLGKAGAQHILAVFEVLEVAALDLGGDHYTGWDMGQTHRGGGLVDLLAASAGRAVNVHLDVLVAQLDLAVVAYLGHDLNGGKGGVTAAGGVERGNAHKAVYAVFAL